MPAQLAARLSAQLATFLGQDITESERISQNEMHGETGLVGLLVIYYTTRKSLIHTPEKRPLKADWRRS